MPTTTTPKTKAPAATAPAAAPTKDSTTDALQQALKDIDRARTNAQGELKTQLDDASERIRSTIAELRDRAGDELRDMEESLERASETLRVELGLRAIRAQRSTEALTKLSSEIRKRKAELTQA